MCQLHACIWGSGDPTQDDQAPPCHCLTPLPHLEPKSKLSSRPCPSLCPQPASALDRQTFPAYPAPLLSSQSPKATQPTRLGAHQTRWVHKGPGMGLGHGCLQELDRSPACRCSNGREGRCKWCWLTGYIFDTFNELIQTFHTRKDSSMLLPLCFGFCLLFRGMCWPRRWPHHTQDWGAGAPAHCALAAPSLGQNGLDAYSVAALCARRHSVIYTRCSN